MDEMLEGIEGALSIVEDVFRAVPSVEEHDSILDRVVERTTGYNARLKLDREETGNQMSCFSTMLCTIPVGHLWLVVYTEVVQEMAVPTFASRNTASHKESVFAGLPVCALLELVVGRSCRTETMH
ncbi:hypothetical protein AGIG_G12825 [Arapaima gigas]